MCTGRPPDSGNEEKIMNMEIRPNRLRECLQKGLPSVGARVESPWPYIAEIAASTGYFDFVEYEGEYAPHTEPDIENVCRADEMYGVATVVKVDRQNRFFQAQKAIACGAHGILLADLYTADEVRETIEALTTSYPGGGIFGRPNRRLCMNGTGRMRMGDYRKMTDEIVKMVMIEKVDAFKNLEEIVSVPGVDMVVFGPFDYATNAGLEMELLPRRSRESARDVESATLRESCSILVESSLALSESESCSGVVSRTLSVGALLCRRSLLGF